MIRYATAAAFKQAVETRLRSSSSSGTDFARRRQVAHAVEAFLNPVLDGTASRI